VLLCFLPLFHQKARFRETHSCFETQHRFIETGWFWIAADACGWVYNAVRFMEQQQRCPYEG